MAKKTNFEVNGKKYYRISATIGVDKDNKRIRKYFYGASKKDAENLRDEYLTNLKNGFAAEYDKAIFEDLYIKWFEVIKRPNITTSSYERYECLFRLYIANTSFIRKTIISINSLDIQRFYNTVDSPNTVKSINLLLKGFFAYCIKEKLIQFNPCANIELPRIKKDSSQKKYLSENDIIKLKPEFAKINNFIYQFALYTGLRQGEILALTYADIKNDIITINKSIKRTTVIEDGVRKSKIITNTPKTQSGYREVPLSSVLVMPLKEHTKLEKAKHLKYGVPFSKKNYIFTSYNCKNPLRADRLTSRWKKLQQSLNIDPVNFHALRHTFCTLLAQNNVPLKTASILMGHANISVTAKIYTHVDNKQKENAISTLDNI